MALAPLPPPRSPSLPMRGCPIVGRSGTPSGSTSGMARHSLGHRRRLAPVILGTDHGRYEPVPGDRRFARAPTERGGHHWRSHLANSRRMALDGARLRGVDGCRAAPGPGATPAEATPYESLITWCPRVGRFEIARRLAVGRALGAPGLDLDAPAACSYGGGRRRPVTTRTTLAQSAAMAANSTPISTPPAA